MEIELTLSATGLLTLDDPSVPQIIARSQYVHVPPWRGEVCEDLSVVAGSFAERYYVHLHSWFDQAELGWIGCKAELQWDNMRHPIKPLAFYRRAATDWPTGLVSWQSAYQFDPDRGTLPGPVWQLAVRTVAVD